MMPHYDSGKQQSALHYLQPFSCSILETDTAKTTGKKSGDRPLEKPPFIKQNMK